MNFKKTKPTCFTQHLLFNIKSDQRLKVSFTERHWSPSRFSFTFFILPLSITPHIHLKSMHSDCNNRKWPHWYSSGGDLLDSTQCSTKTYICTLQVLKHLETLKHCPILLAPIIFIYLFPRKARKYFLSCDMSTQLFIIYVILYLY